MSNQFTQLPGNALSNLYADGCNVAYATATTATIATGQVRDSTNSFDIAITSELTLNMEASGVNGIDTGVFTADSIYYVFVVFDETYANPPACVASLSQTSPVMPSLHGSTYSQFRMVGLLFSDATPELLNFAVCGTGNARFYQPADSTLPLSGGNSTITATISLDGFIPASNYGRVQLRPQFTPFAAGSVARIGTFDSTEYVFVDSGIVAAVVQISQIDILPTNDAGIPTLTYLVDNAGSALDLRVTGFEFFI